MSSKKPKPRLIIGHFENILKSFENRKDQKDIQDLIRDEGIIEVFPSSQQKNHNIVELYIVTQYATIVFLRYDISKQSVLDPIKINSKVKELLNYKIDKITVSENLCARAGGQGMIMLIEEHALLCQIRIQDDMMLMMNNNEGAANQPQFADAINE